MQILIQGSDRRIKFTKGEVAKLKVAATLVYELSQHTEDESAIEASAHLQDVLGRIDASGVYRQPASE